MSQAWSTWYIASLCLGKHTYIMWILPSPAMATTQKVHLQFYAAYKEGRKWFIRWGTPTVIWMLIAWVVVWGRESTFKSLLPATSQLTAVHGYKAPCTCTVERAMNNQLGPPRRRLYLASQQPLAISLMSCLKGFSRWGFHRNMTVQF